MSELTEIWILKESLNFGPTVSSNPKDHCVSAPVFRIPICVDNPELAVHMVEKSALDTVKSRVAELERDNKALVSGLKKHLAENDKLSRLLRRAVRVLEKANLNVYESNRFREINEELAKLQEGGR